jgi:hypothetical protein
VVHNAHPTEDTGGGTDFSKKVDNLIGELSTEAWRKVTLPTFDGMFWVLREAIRAFKKRGGGTIRASCHRIFTNWWRILSQGRSLRNAC